MIIGDVVTIIQIKDEVGMWKSTILLFILLVFVSLPFFMISKAKRQLQHYEYTSDKDDSARTEQLIREIHKRAQKEDLKQYLRVI
ncbi:MAG: hypothetical protein ICV65_04240 [Flavisolibacter sp.]|nr:hypothetical protein [Flavisolibacter sp.]